MKKLMIAALLAAGFVAPVSANEVVDACMEYAASQGSDDAGCGCLGEAAAEDEALAAALLEITSPEDLESADDATRAAITACFPDA